MKIKPFKSRVRPGAWSDMPAKVYHGAPGLSSTMLRVLLRSPLEYHRRMTGQTKSQPTAAMEFGTVAHSAILENRFDGFYIQPDTYGDKQPWNNRASECKEWNALHADKPVLTSEQVRQLSEANSYLANHPKASKLLSRSKHYEVSLIADGIKARCDHIAFDGDVAIITDLKTTVDAESVAFSKEILNRGYHIQAAWYARVAKALGAKFVRFYFIALQKGALPLVNVLELSAPAIKLGDSECERALILLGQCQTAGYWPEWSDYDGSNEIKTVDVPSWAQPEEELTGMEEV